MGGLSKKAYQLDNISNQIANEQLRLDAGNLLFKHSVVAKGPSQEELTAEAIMQIYTNLHYDAVGIGPLDLSAGVHFLQTSQNEGFPWISANILDKHGKPLFPQWKNKTIKGLDIVITALSAAPEKLSADVQVASWQSVLPDLPALNDPTLKDAFIILLSTLPTTDNQLIAENFPRINLILGADPQQRNMSPKQVNNSLITQTEKQGKYQGVLEIIFGGRRQWSHDRQQDMADLQNSLGSLNWQLRRLEKKAAASDQKEQYSVAIKRLQREKANLSQEITTMEGLIADERSSTVPGDQYEYRFIALTKKMPEDITTQAQLRTLNQRIRQLHKEKSQADNLQKQTEKKTVGNTLSGFKVCGQCHTRQLEFWQNTPHAKAYTTLLDKGKNLDLDCLPCHITQDLFNKTGAKATPTELLSLPPELLSVGCETCHGPGSQHSANPKQSQMGMQPPEDICLTCHSSEHDDNFNYETKIIQVSCPRG